MTHRLLLGLCAGLLLAATTRADVLPLQFDDTIPPTTPAGDSAFPTEIPCGKSLVIPVAASNPNGGTLVYSATSSNPSIMVRVRTGNPVLSLGISHNPAVSGSDIAVSGTLQLMLFRDFTPITAGIIGGMAQGKYYDGVPFHRIAAEFMAQGGDPTGSGTGGPPFTFPNEFKLPLIFTGKGQLAMAHQDVRNSIFATNSSQFFITYNSQFRNALDLGYTIFGQILRGWDTLYQMSQVENVNGVPMTNNDSDGGTSPKAPVTITSANVIKTNDAVLYLSATGTGSANITVTISDPVSGAAPVSTTFAVTSVVDTVNDPVIFVPPSDTIAPAKGKATVILQTQDLEFDHPIFGYQFLASSSSNGVVSASGILGNKLIVSGTPSTYLGPLDLWVQTAASGASSATDQGVLSVRIGGKALVPQPATVSVATGTSAIVAGGFLDKDSTASAAKYSASINWGDGTVSSGSDAIVAKDPKAGSAARFLVSGTHAYPNPGIYPLYVAVYASQSASVEPLTKMYGVANVSGGDLLAKGLTLSSNGGNISRQQVATFQDFTPLAPGAYHSVIDWGDGVTTTGTVLKLSGSTSFRVLGTHRYTDSATYSVNVSITKNSQTVNAWSTALVSKINKPSFLPPFPQAHLTLSFPAPLGAALSGSTSNDSVIITGTMVVTNIGSKKSAASSATAQFYYSTNGSLQGSTLLPYQGKNQITIPALNPGASYTIAFPISRPIFWPAGTAVDYVDKTIFFVLNWSDPLAQLEPVNLTESRYWTPVSSSGN